MFERLARIWRSEPNVDRHRILPERDFAAFRTEPLPGDGLIRRVVNTPTGLMLWSLPERVPGENRDGLYRSRVVMPADKRWKCGAGIFALV